MGISGVSDARPHAGEFESRAAGGIEYRVELHNAAAEIFALCRAEGNAGAAPLQARA